MSLLSEDEREDFRRLLRALGASKDEFVIAGGQASRILRLHPLATTLDWPPLLTSDIDVATKLRGHATNNDIGKALEAEGFEIDFVDSETPPLTHYVRGPTEIEFIVPVTPERRSSGAVVRILGITAQKVDDLDLVIQRVTAIELPEVGVIRVPTPAAYILQKILTLENRRELLKKGKDALYVHDALHLFTHENRLRTEVVAEAIDLFQRLPKSRQSSILATAKKLCSADTDFVVEASRQAEGRPRPHTAEILATFMRLSLNELLGREIA